MSLSSSCHNDKSITQLLIGLETTFRLVLANDLLGNNKMCQSEYLHPIPLSKEFGLQINYVYSGIR